MNVVGTAFHQAVGVGIGILAIHALIMRAGDDVPEMLDDAIGDEGLAVVVEVQAPGIGGAVTDDVEKVSGGVKPPDAAIDLGAADRSVPGLPMLEVVVMPWQPHSQPSGPQLSWLATLCLILTLSSNPSRHHLRRAERLARRPWE